jgi:hypothetical protein
MDGPLTHPIVRGHLPHGVAGIPPNLLPDPIDEDEGQHPHCLPGATPGPMFQGPLDSPVGHIPGFQGLHNLWDLVPSMEQLNNALVVVCYFHQIAQN